jgi:hypothetical protein
VGFPASRATAAASTPIQVYGAWHCSDDQCTWGHPRSVTEFDSRNHWHVDRGDGRPSVNLVVLSFVNPLKLLHETTDATTLNGVPRGMTADIVTDFKAHGVRVMFSIDGITYVDAWNQVVVCCLSPIMAASQGIGPARVAPANPSRIQGSSESREAGLVRALMCHPTPGRHQQVVAVGARDQPAGHRERGLPPILPEPDVTLGPKINDRHPARLTAAAASPTAQEDRGYV